MLWGACLRSSPLSRVKRTLREAAIMSAKCQKRTLRPSADGLPARQSQQDRVAIYGLPGDLLESKGRDALGVETYPMSAKLPHRI
jgi:hypothetical protein